MIDCGPNRIIIQFGLAPGRPIGSQRAPGRGPARGAIMNSTLLAGGGAPACHKNQGPEVSGRAWGSFKFKLNANVRWPPALGSCVWLDGWMDGWMDVVVLLLLTPSAAVVMRLAPNGSLSATTCQWRGCPVLRRVNDACKYNDAYLTITRPSRCGCGCGCCAWLRGHVSAPPAHC